MKLFSVRRHLVSCCLAVSAVVAGCGPSDDLSTPEAVEDIASMQYNPSTGRYDVICKNGTHESVTAEQIRSNQVCGGGGGGGTSGSVSFYHSDSCSGSLLATVRFSDNPDWNETRCMSLAGGISSSVWGVRLGNGQCEDISDTSFLTACRAFQGVPDAGDNVVRYYHSDSCNGSMLGSLRFSGNHAQDDQVCANVGSSVTSAVWGVRLANGQCEDISDVSFPVACNLFRGGRAAPGGSSVQFYHSDSCNGSMIASLNFGPNPDQNRQLCNNLGSQVSTSVWGIRVDSGRCEDISDTSFLNACLRFQ